MFPLGASSGIGRETAVHFSQLGANLVLAGRNQERLAETQAKCTQVAQNTDQQVLMVNHQAQDLSTNETLIKQTINKFSRLDVLVNNAGTIEYGTIETTSVEQYDRVMDVNLKSIYHLTQLALPHLLQSKGNIVNVSSVNGLRSFPNVLAYCVSKSALDQFTRCTAIELGGKGVRVNSVNPGVISTGLQLRAGLTEEQYAGFMERSKETHALGRVGEADEVASVITFLASEGASYITGATLPVDGGRHALCPR